MKKYLYLFLFLVIQVSWGQVKISGSIKDADTGEALIGATIREAETSNGAQADVEGNFTLTVLNEEAIISVSFVGYKTQDQIVGVQTIFNFNMEVDYTALDEVVVVGYGTQQRSDVTGAITSVNTEDMEEKKVSSVDQFLKGRAAGVQIQQNQGDPGAASTVQIRGINSLSSNTQPLYVVDGIPIDNPGQEPDPFNDAQTEINPLLYLNPQDIESVEVLKDASATAIYGSRGANGVIIITTKKGEKDNFTVQLNSSFGFSEVRKKIPVLTGPGFARYKNEAALSGGADAPYSNPDAVIWTDWQDDILQRAFYTNNRVSISSGQKKNNYYLAAGYQNNQGIFKGTGMKKGDVRLNFNNSMTEKLEMTLSFATANIQTDMTQSNGRGGSTNSSAIRTMISRNPILQRIEGEAADLLNTPTDWVNNYADDGTRNTLNSNAGFKYVVNDRFSINLRGGYNFSFSERLRYYGTELVRGAGGGYAGYSNFFARSYNGQLLGSYNNGYSGDWRFSSTVGVTYSLYDNRFLSSTAQGFPGDDLQYEQFGIAANPGPTYRTRTKQELASALGRFVLNYKRKYIITTNIRLDGSSVFGEGNKYGFFPSMAFAWRAKEESFLKNVDAVYDLKFRLGWGQTGNGGIQPYASLAQYEAAYYQYGSQSSSGLQYTQFANPDLRWETSEQVNFGVDFGFLNGRLTGVIDIYQKVNKDMLIRQQLPSSTGFDVAWINYGSLQNRGVDVELSGVVVDKVLTWKVSGNLSVYRNEIQDLNSQVSDYGYVQFFGNNLHQDGVLQVPVNTFIEGKAAGLFWGFSTDGVYQNQEQVDAHLSAGNTYFGRAAKPGDIVYVDRNLDGQINDLDKGTIGDPNPDFTWGITNTFKFRNYGLDFTFYGVQGKDVLNANLNAEERVDGTFWNIRRAAWNGRWQGEGTSNYYAAVSNDFVSNKVSDRLVEDASFIRLGNITLSYTTTFSERYSTKFFVSGTNLLTITKYKGYDPEVNSFGSDQLRIGIDNNAYPTSWTLMAGVNVTLK